MKKAKDADTDNKPVDSNKFKTQAKQYSTLALKLMRNNSAKN